MVNETLAGTTTTVGSQSGKKGLIDSEEDKGCEGFKGLNITEVKRDTNWDTDQDGMPDWWEEVKGVSDGNADENADATPISKNISTGLPNLTSPSSRAKA